MALLALDLEKNTNLLALDKEKDTNLLTLKKKPEMNTIGHNGFKYNYRGVAKGRYKYRARVYCKNPATSSTYHTKWLGTYEYATEAAKVFDDYLIATNGDKTKLNFASESEYLLALDKEKNTNSITLKKKPVKIKIGHNGFKYNYRGVYEESNKYRARMYCKNPATSHSSRSLKCLGIHEYATDAAKAYDHYLIATNGNKRKLNFASESEYNLALDEEKNFNLLVLKKNTIDIGDSNAIWI